MPRARWCHGGGVTTAVLHGGGAGQIARNLGATPFRKGMISVELLGREARLRPFGLCGARRLLHRDVLQLRHKLNKCILTYPLLPYKPSKTLTVPVSHYRTTPRSSSILTSFPVLKLSLAARPTAMARAPSTWFAPRRATAESFSTIPGRGPKIWSSMRSSPPPVRVSALVESTGSESNRAMSTVAVARVHRVQETAAWTRFLADALDTRGYDSTTLLDDSTDLDSRISTPDSPCPPLPIS